MARNTPTKVKIALELEVDQQDYDTLASGSPGDLMKFLKANVGSYLHEYANGGLTISGEEVDRIKKATKKSVETSDDIVNAVEKSKKLKGGQNVFEEELDPSLVGSFEHIAEFLGVTLEQFITMCWSEIHANAWLYQMQPNVRWVPFDLEDMKRLQDAKGSDTPFSSADVLKILTKAASE